MFCSLQEAKSHIVHTTVAHYVASIHPCTTLSELDAISTEMMQKIVDVTRPGQIISFSQPQETTEATEDTEADSTDC